MLRFLSVCACLLCLTACRSVDSPPPPTPTTMHVIDATLVPTVERDLHAVASETPELEPTRDACESTAGLPTTRHTVSAKIDYERHSVVVQQQLRTINRGSEALDAVVLDVEPNRFGGVFTLDSVTSDHGVQSHELSARRLTIDLLRPLAPGCTLEVDLAFRVKVHPIGRGSSGYDGYLGYSNRQLNLAQWLPTLAIRRNGQWITHDVIAIGEQTVTDVADWDVTLTVTDSPPHMVVAAPGALISSAAMVWHYTLANAREFAASLSPLFDVRTEAAADGVQVELYAFGDSPVDTPDGKVSGAQQSLDAAAQALALYADLFGAFPYQRMVVVQADFPDGMEFSDLVFVSDIWFRTNPGTPQSYLTLITVHEIAHQWWYARVGSDQALTPWMDEALATYSEYIFYQEQYPDLADWWWQFRVDAFVPKDYNGKKVDSTVYDFADGRTYINAVYLRGALMLDDLRQALGTDVFFDWLRRYAQVGDDRVVTPDVFWSLLTPEQLDLINPIRQKYFKTS